MLPYVIPCVVLLLETSAGVHWRWWCFPQRPCFRRPRAPVFCRLLLFHVLCSCWRRPQELATENVSPKYTSNSHLRYLLQIWAGEAFLICIWGLYSRLILHGIEIWPREAFLIPLPQKKKTQKSKHLQTVIPNVLQELATDTELSKTSAGVHRWLCYPMCYAFAGDLCRSPLTMMISSTETELSKTSSRISLAQCWTAWLGDIVKQGWCAPLVLLQGLPILSSRENVIAPIGESEGSLPSEQRWTSLS